MIHFVPSIGFTGQCAETIKVYAKAFNAKILEKVLFSSPIAKNNGYICTAYVVVEDKFGICWEFMSGYKG